MKLGRSTLGSPFLHPSRVPARAAGLQRGQRRRPSRVEEMEAIDDRHRDCSFRVSVVDHFPDRRLDRSDPWRTRRESRASMMMRPRKPRRLRTRSPRSRAMPRRPSARRSRRPVRRSRTWASNAMNAIPWTSGSSEPIRLRRPLGHPGRVEFDHSRLSIHLSTKHGSPSIHATLCNPLRRARLDLRGPGLRRLGWRVRTLREGAPLRFLVLFVLSMIFGRRAGPIV